MKTQSLKAIDVVCMASVVTALMLVCGLGFTHSTSKHICDCEASRHVLRHLDRVSWMVNTCGKGGTGSGFTVTRNGIHYVITAGHVVAKCQQVKKVVDQKSGLTKYVCDYSPVKLLQIETVNGREVGEHSYYADIIRYSAHEASDVAVLRLRKTHLFIDSVEFSSEILKPGTKLIHVGSPGGQQGVNTISFGTFSQAGRVRNNNVYDQIVIPADHGSSGCGIYLPNGKCVGILVEGNGHYPEAQQIYIRPARELRKWSKKVGVEFLFDSHLNVPTERELSSFPVNDVPAAAPVEKPRNLPPADTFPFPFPFFPFPVR